jgi:hypothetical protein
VSVQLSAWLHAKMYMCHFSESTLAACMLLLLLRALPLAVLRNDAPGYVLPAPLVAPSLGSHTLQLSGIQALQTDTTALQAAVSKVQGAATSVIGVDSTGALPS